MTRKLLLLHHQHGGLAHNIRGRKQIPDDAELRELAPLVEARRQDRPDVEASPDDEELEIVDDGAQHRGGLRPVLHRLPHVPHVGLRRPARVGVAGAVLRHDFLEHLVVQHFVPLLHLWVLRRRHDVDDGQSDTTTRDLFMFKDDN